MRIYILVALCMGFTSYAMYEESRYAEESREFAILMMRLNNESSKRIKPRIRRKPPLLPKPANQAVILDLPQELFVQPVSIVACCLCAAQYANKQALHNHFWEIHFEQPITECPLCKQRFRWSNVITKHEKEAHPDKEKFQMQIIASEINS